jgi:hypothetical protein
MSANNGDKARFHRLRKAKFLRRKRMLALRVELALLAKKPDPVAIPA